MTTTFSIHPITPQDHECIHTVMIKRRASVEIVSRGSIHIGDQLPGFVASENGTPAGIITYHIEATNVKSLLLTV